MILRHTRQELRRPVITLYCYALSLLLITGCASQHAAPQENLPPTTATVTTTTAPQNGEEAYLRGMEFANPKQGEPDFAKAHTLFEQSYGTGNLKAAHALGWLYFSGKGVEKDPRKAFLFFKDAAEHGNHPDSQHMLSLLYGNGWGVAKDTKLSWYWTQRAAANGHPEAQAILRAMRVKSLPMKK
ncbi:MAG: tetratricopeptide repeat protein [Thermodesulfobacteriota bacterium]